MSCIKCHEKKEWEHDLYYEGHEPRNCKHYKKNVSPCSHEAEAYAIMREKLDYYNMRIMNKEC